VQIKADDFVTSISVTRCNILMKKITNDEKTWAMYCHLSSLLCFIIPFGNYIGTVLIWLLKKNKSEFINITGKEAINFQIFCTIIAIISTLLWSYFIGMLIAVFFLIYAVIEILLAATKSRQGQLYYYKISLRLIK